MLREIISGVTHTGTHLSTSTHSTDKAMNANGIFIRSNFSNLLNMLCFMVVMVCWHRYALYARFF
jgi:hypothetical protein